MWKWYDYEYKDDEGNISKHGQWYWRLSTVLHYTHVPEMCQQVIDEFLDWKPPHDAEVALKSLEDYMKWLIEEMKSHPYSYFTDGHRNDAVTNFVIMCDFVGLDYEVEFKEIMWTKDGFDFQKERTKYKFDDVNWTYYLTDWQEYGRLHMVDKVIQGWHDGLDKKLEDFDYAMNMRIWSEYNLHGWAKRLNAIDDERREGYFISTLYRRRNQVDFYHMHHGDMQVKDDDSPKFLIEKLEPNNKNEEE